MGALNSCKKELCLLQNSTKSSTVPDLTVPSCLQHLLSPASIDPMGGSKDVN